MNKILTSIFILSLLGNIILAYTLNLQTVYFDNDVFWNSVGEFQNIRAQGVIIFNNEREQSDTKKLVEHYKFECENSECNGVRSKLIGNTTLVQDSFKPEIIKISHDEKFAVFKHLDCVFTISGENTTFICPEKNESGSLGDHIELHFKQHSLF